MYTRDTVGKGSGMPRYAKVQHRTRTRNTRFGNTVGISVPMTNPTNEECLTATDSFVRIHVMCPWLTLCFLSDLCKALCGLSFSLVCKAIQALAQYVDIQSHPVPNQVVFVTMLNHPQG